MNSPYFNSLLDFKSLTSTSPVAKHIFTELYDSCKTTKKAPSINEILEHLEKILSSIPFIPGDYFYNYFERFAYENIFNIFAEAFYSHSLTKNKSKKMRDYIEKYLAQTNEPISENIIEQEISKKKKQLQNDLNGTCSYRSTNGKFNTFYTHIGAPLFEEVNPLLDDADYIFTLRNYAKTIYSEKNIHTGIQIYSFYNDIVCAYMSQYAAIEKPSFKKEFSAFLFEEIHFPIQYLNCISSYLNAPFSKTKIPDNYWTLFIFAKIFDTHNLSVTDFILDKYSKDLQNLYSPEHESLRYRIFVESQFLKSYWIRILNLILKQVLYLIYNGDINTIATMCKEYISNKLSNNYTYCNLLKEASEHLATAEYPRTKDKVNSVSPKTDSIEQLFNYSISMCFFMYEPPLPICQSAYTLDSIYDFINATYTNYKKEYSGKVFKTSSEFIYRKLPTA